jgi:hypothetical protein
MPVHPVIKPKPDKQTNNMPPPPDIPVIDLTKLDEHTEDKHTEENEPPGRTPIIDLEDVDENDPALLERPARIIPVTNPHNASNNNSNSAPVGLLDGIVWYANQQSTPLTRENPANTSQYVSPYGPAPPPTRTMPQHLGLPFNQPRQQMPLSVGRVQQHSLPRVAPYQPQFPTPGLHQPHRLAQYPVDNRANALVPARAPIHQFHRPQQSPVANQPNTHGPARAPVHQPQQSLVASRQNAHAPARAPVHQPPTYGSVPFEPYQPLGSLPAPRPRPQPSLQVLIRQVLLCARAWPFELIAEYLGANGFPGLNARVVEEIWDTYQDRAEMTREGVVPIQEGQGQGQGQGRGNFSGGM